MNRPATRRLWLSAAEVADLFGVHPRTIGRWIDDGMLPGYQLPGKRKSHRVLRVRLIEFCNQRPEFKFVLELLDGQPITARQDPSQGHQAEEDWIEEPPADTGAED